MKIGFIGAGKAGCSLSGYLKGSSVTISGFCSKTYAHAKRAADDTLSVAFSDLKQLISISDIIFITTPDSMISKVWEEIRALAADKVQITGKIFCHCSGSRSSLIFEHIQELGAFRCAAHPMRAISSRDTDLTGTFFTLDGDEEAVSVIGELLKNKGNPVSIIDSACKVKYHMASSAASNLMVALADLAVEALAECGFSSQRALEMLTPLMMGNMENICTKGTAEALTGPVERGDCDTVQKHLSQLSGEDKEIYRLLSGRLVQIARKKNPERNYSVLEHLLEEKNQ